MITPMLFLLCATSGPGEVDDPAATMRDAAPVLVPDESITPSVEGLEPVSVPASVSGPMSVPEPAEAAPDELILSGASLDTNRPGQAASASESGRSDVYIKVLGGLGWLDDTSVERTTGAGKARGSADFDGGFLAGLAVGTRLAPRWRLEGEYVYRTNDIDGLSNAALGSSGDFASTTLAANLLYDLTEEDELTPYVGVGAGYVTEIDIDFEGAAFAGERSYSGSGYMAQLMVGARWAVSDAVDLSLEGRWARFGGFDLDGEANAPGEVDADYDHTSVVFGASFGL